MSNWHPMDKPIDLKHLGKLCEELAECVSAASRCMIQGIDEAEPTTGKINRQWLEEEIADALTSLHMVIDHFDLDEGEIHKRQFQKRAKLIIWHQQS